ncbi:MAG: hypothetical protein CMP20_02600 [Rickettsiales bacterium]|nr:hypothetical protein [Rickettsiales bacterium]
MIDNLTLNRRLLRLIICYGLAMLYVLSLKSELSDSIEKRAFEVHTLKIDDLGLKRELKKRSTI